MKNTLRNYKITLETLSPVHIGSGEAISKKNCVYMEKKGIVYILNSVKLFEGLKAIEKLQAYEQYLLNYRENDFYKFLMGNQITESRYSQWAAYKLRLDNLRVVSESRSSGGGHDDIQAFLKDSFGCPYIPGSSLKGAVRTAVESALMLNNNSFLDEIKNAKPARPKEYLSYTDKKIAQNLFNKLNRNTEKTREIVNDVFAAMRISDSKPLDVADLTLCQKIDLRTDGGENNLPLRRECLRPGVLVEFGLEIDTDLLQNSGFDFSPEFIVDALDKHIKSQREKFLNSFKKVPTCDSKSGNLIYIGGGSGFHSKTIIHAMSANKKQALDLTKKILSDTLKREHKHEGDSPVSPRVRKCTYYQGDLYDMGLCSFKINS